MTLPLRTIRGEMEINEVDGTYRVTTPKTALTDVLTVRLHGGGGDLRSIPNQRLYYEALVETSGAIILGLAGPKFETAVDDAPHLPEVGDHANSWGFEGSRRRKRCIDSSMYGERWKVGDVVGVLLDIDRGEIRFGLNGKDLGVAFEIPSEDLHSVYPAASLHFGQSVRLNFGRAPFMYDPPGVPEVEVEGADSVNEGKQRGKGKPQGRAAPNRAEGGAGTTAADTPRTSKTKGFSSGTTTGDISKGSKVKVDSSGDEGSDEGEPDSEMDQRAGEAESGQEMLEQQTAHLERLLSDEDFKIKLRQLQVKQAMARRELLMTQRKQLAEVKAKREQKVRMATKALAAQQSRTKRSASPTGSSSSAQNGRPSKKRPRVPQSNQDRGGNTQ